MVLIFPYILCHCVTGRTNFTSIKLTPLRYKKYTALHSQCKLIPKSDRYRTKWEKLKMTGRNTIRIQCVIRKSRQENETMKNQRDSQAGQMYI